MVLPGVAQIFLHPSVSYLRFHRYPPEEDDRFKDKHIASESKREFVRPEFASNLLRRRFSIKLFVSLVFEFLFRRSAQRN